MLKPPKTIEEQIKLLEERGIIIDDYDFTKVFLGDNINRTMRIFDSLFILNKIFLDRTLWSDFLKIIDIVITDNKDIIDLKLIGFPEDYLTKLGNEKN